MTGLLEKTDKDFKTALDNIISTDVWVAAQSLARERRKQARSAGSGSPRLKIRTSSRKCRVWSRQILKARTKLLIKRPANRLCSRRERRLLAICFQTIPMMNFASG